MQQWGSIDTQISAYLDRNFSSRQHQSVSGGCINQAWRISDDKDTFFVKLNTANHLNMFAAEFEGLKTLYQTNTIRVPTPISVGKTQTQAYLVTEYLELSNSADAAQLGEQLAQLHRTQHSAYGWHRDNTIGSTPQQNSYQNDWIRFWRQQRLGYQLSLARNKGYTRRLQDLGEQLSARMADFFPGDQPTASLLHGDLWSGNVGAIKGTPVIFDPAVYFGDRECDLAMTELFGGFSPRFYAAYNANWPLDPGYNIRKNLYNLYHLLNHLNLFGTGYQSQCLQTMQGLLAEVK